MVAEDLKQRRSEWAVVKGRELHTSWFFHCRPDFSIVPRTSQAYADFVNTLKIDENMNIRLRA